MQLYRIYDKAEGVFMGTYAELYSGKDYSTIPDNKRKEFAKRIERLFQEGGMMRIKPNILFGKRVYTIHKVKMGKNGVQFNYNYFEEEEWENAGFDKENYCVFSEKFGHKDFSEVMVAAYMLEEYYVEKTAVVRLDDENVRDWIYVGWMNHLFDEHYHVKNHESRKLFNLFHGLEENGCRDEEDINNQEFMDLWKLTGIGELRYFEEYYNKGKYYIKPITTAGFLNRDPNDLIYFWNEKAGFDFSKELYIWFKVLKVKFDYLMEDEGRCLEAFKEEPLRHIVDIMEAAEENYYHILTFTEFLEETKEHIEDKCYWALWKMYEDMVFDSELIKAGSVIFAPEGTENRRNGFWEFKRKSKRALSDDWASIPKEKKNNDGRKILRRYMALVANKKLRCKVFGF